MCYVSFHVHGVYVTIFLNYVCVEMKQQFNNHEDWLQETKK
jgi:hypothetical protein